jgi:ATP phosphoribosyltransferase regulatory subunit HisZ
MLLHVEDYDKQVNFERYSDGYGQAAVRAKRLDELATAAGTCVVLPAPVGACRTALACVRSPATRLLEALLYLRI